MHATTSDVVPFDVEVARASELLTDVDLQSKRPLIVVVGGRASNYPDWMRVDKRIDIWTDLVEHDKCPTLPASTKVVVCSRFVRTHQYKLVSDNAAGRGAFFFPHVRQTHEIRRIVEALLKVDRGGDRVETPLHNTPRLTVVDAPKTPPNALQRVGQCPSHDDGYECDLSTGRVGDHVITLDDDTTHTWSSAPPAPPAPTKAAASDEIDAAIAIVGEAMAALSMVNETLQRARSAAQKVEDARAALRAALLQIGG